MPANRVTSNSPWHLILVLDDSGSMSGQPSSDVNQAVIALVDEMKLLSQGLKPYFKLSVVVFGSHARSACEAVSENAVDMTAITALSGSSGSTNAAAALQEANAILLRNPGKATDFVPYVFFLSDGAPDDVGTALAAGTALKGLSVAAGTPHLVTIGFGSVNDSFMSQLASNPELYKKLANSREIVKLFPSIGTMAQTATGAAGVDQAIMNI